MKAPCYGCEDRTLICHDSCERHKAFKSELETIKRERKGENEFLAYRKNCFSNKDIQDIERKKRQGGTLK